METQNILDDVKVRTADKQIRRQCAQERFLFTFSRYAGKTYTPCAYGVRKDCENKKLDIIERSRNALRQLNIFN